MPNTAWDERTLTYANRPAISTTVVGTVGPGKKGEWKSVDVTTDVKAHLGYMWSVAIENPAPTYDSLYFASKKSSSNKPQLIVELVPPEAVPTTVPNITAVPTVTTTPTPILSPSAAPTVTGVRTPTPSRTPSPSRTPTPFVSKAPTPTVFSPTAAPGQATYPSQVLNLTNWKVTLPTGSIENPTEIKQTALATFKASPYFEVITDANGNGVRFRAPVDGVSTNGSVYPRSELREMKNNGVDNAGWSSTSGTHTMYIEQAITHLSDIKKHIVVGQIHDGNDVIVIRLENRNNALVLFVDIAGNDGPILDTNYTLGKKFNVKFVASGGKTMIYYNGSVVNNAGSSTPFALSKAYSNAYFKAGAYTQSYCMYINGVKTEKGVETNCSPNNYGEAIIYKLDVTHQ